MGIRNILTSPVKARLKLWGNRSDLGVYEKGPDVDNVDMLTALDSAGTSEVDLLGVDANNRLRLGGSLFNPMRSPIVLRVQPTASQATTFPFYLKGASVEPAEIDSIMAVFDTADGAANTGWVTKDGPGVVPGAGLLVQTGTFNLNATANTVQTAVLNGVRAVPGSNLNTSLSPGDSLTFNIASAVTNLKGLVVVVFFKQHATILPALAYLNANAGIITRTIYLNIVPGTQVSGVSMRWAVKATDAGAVTVDITKDTGTTAPGAGTTILAAAQSVKGTINTTVYPALSATASVLLMASGDRLAIKVTGVTTALAGLVVSVSFTPGMWHDIVIQDQHFLNVNVDGSMFIADGFYEIVDVWGTWSVISTSVTFAPTIERGTTAPGGGTSVLNGTIDTSQTANTPLEGTLAAAKPSLILSPGDRLSSHLPGTIGTLAGLCTAVRLRKL